MLFCLVAALSVPLFGQSGRGTITGTVTDSTGGVMPGVEIVATDMDTGVETRGVTTDVGMFRLPYVTPGRYKVSAILSGFKTAVRENVQVLITSTVTLDFQLEVGDLSEQVTVSTTAPLLEKSTSEIGTAATELEVHTWPIMVDDGTRQLQNFIFTSMPGTQGGTWSGSINGGQSFAHEILIDGISIGRMDLNGGSNNEFTPTVDAVGEFKLQTGATSSQYGNSQTGLTNFSMKSGTNDYHGTAFWFVQNEALNAMSWGDNAAGSTKKPRSRLNNFGATFGGPIIKDRTHFFFSYEGNRVSDYVIGNPRGDSLPVKPFKGGDFSLLLDPNFTKDNRSGTVIGKDALGRDVLFGQIYDPASAYQLADGTWIRNPFPNNMIPAGRMSAVSQNVLRYDLPEPAVFQLALNNPRVGASAPQGTIDNYSFKMDHVLNDSHKMSGTYVFNDRSRLRYGASQYYYLPEPKIPGSPLAGDKTQATPGWIGRFSEDWTVSPTKLNHFALGYNRFFNKNVSNSYFDGRDWAKDLGLQGVAGATFPELRFDGFDNALSGRYRRMGHQGTSNEPNGSVVVADDFTLIHGSHSFRIGGEHRRYYLNGRSVNTPGMYLFHNENTALPGSYYKGDPSDPTTPKANGSTATGFAYASFFLGEVRTTGNGITLLTPGIRSRTTALYFQDDWKVRSNVTLNLGIRWDIPSALSEAAGRMSGLNPTMSNPGADGYPGALEFLSDRSSFGETYWKEFGPRVGIAWAKGEKMVIRGGYGINYAPPIMDGWDFGYFNGFNGSNNINVRSKSRFAEDASFRWDNPYPAYTKTLPNTDPALVNGGDPYYYGPEANQLPMTQNWNVGIQYELPWQTRLEANYVGTKGTRLNDGYTYYLNSLDPKYMSLGDTLLDDISDHPEIKKPYPSFDGTVAQALRPFPQYNSVGTHRLSSSWSNYNSLQVTATKRSSNGLSFLLAYTYSKALGTADSAMAYYSFGQDIYNRQADYSVTAFNVPHDLRVTWIYEFPSRVVGQPALDRVIGGWTMSAIHHYRSGSPISISTGGYEGEALYNAGWRPDVLLPTDQQKLAGEPETTDIDNGVPYLNPKAFASLPTTDGNIPLHFGNAPRFLDGVRGFKIMTEDFSLLKRVNLGFRESSNVEIRIDVVNLFNRARPEDPRTNIDDQGEFGRSYGKVGGNRRIQAGLRVNF